MQPFTEEDIKQMESRACRFLKRLLKLFKMQTPNQLNLNDKGVRIKSVRSACLKSQVSKDIIFRCSRDRDVSRTVSARREVESNSGHNLWPEFYSRVPLMTHKWNPVIKPDETLQWVSFRFRGQTDKRGLGHMIYENFWQQMVAARTQSIN